MWLEVLRFLVESKSDVELTDHLGNTALHLAAETNFAAACGSLACARAPMDAANAAGSVPLLVAAERGHSECCKVLLEEGEANHLPLALQIAASSGFVPLGVNDSC